MLCDFPLLRDDQTCFPCACQGCFSAKIWLLFLWFLATLFQNSNLSSISLIRQCWGLLASHSVSSSAFYCLSLCRYSVETHLGSWQDQTQSKGTNRMGRVCWPSTIYVSLWINYFDFSLYILGLCLLTFPKQVLLINFLGFLCGYFLSHYSQPRLVRLGESHTSKCRAHRETTLEAGKWIMILYRVS